MIIQENLSNKIRKKIQSLAFNIFHSLENNGNANPKQNGEFFLIDQLFRSLEIGDNKTVFFDVGANIGNYTQALLDKSLELKNKNLEIHAFEPTQKSFRILQERFQKYSHIFVNKKAISNQEGEAEIFYDESGSSLASLYKRDLNSIGLSMEQSETVETITLRAYIKSRSIDHISFLKIDVEGHEFKVLSSLDNYLNSEFIDFIQFEYGGANLDSRTSLKDFYNLFEPLGYMIAKVMPSGLDVRVYQDWMDNFQYANYVAISQNYLERL